MMSNDFAPVLETDGTVSKENLEVIRSADELAVAVVKSKKQQRLSSLDALRGFGMFWVTGGRPLILAGLEQS